MNNNEGDGQRRQTVLPPKQGLYDPQFEHDACGVGFVADIKGRKSHEIVKQALTLLNNLTHRGARGSEANTGDGAGILIQTPHAFLQKIANIKSFNLPGPGQYGVGMVFLPLVLLTQRLTLLKTPSIWHKLKVAHRHICFTTGLKGRRHGYLAA